MLHGHRCRDHGKGFVGREQPMPTGQQVALEPTFAQVLAQHLQHAAIWRQVIVDIERSADETAVFDLENVAQSVRVRLVGAEQAEVPRLGIA